MAMMKKIIIFICAITVSQSYGQQTINSLYMALSGNSNIAIGTTENFKLIYHPESAINQGNIEPKEIKKISYKFFKEDSHLTAKEGKSKVEILVTAEKGAKANSLDVNGFFTKPKKFKNVNIDSFFALSDIIPFD